MAWQDWAAERKSDNFARNFKLDNRNHGNLKDGNESHAEFEGVLCRNENELQSTQRIKTHCVIGMGVVAFLLCCAKQDHAAFDFSIARKKKDHGLFLFLVC